MAKPWEKYAGAPSSTKPWEKYGGSSEMPLLAPPAVSQTESALRGVAQGASLGFADEALGALSNAANKFVNPTASLFDSENYEKVRDDQRSADQAAKVANPGTFLAGEIGGGAALPLGGMNLAKGALVGGAQALGSSNAEDLGGMAQDSLLGAGLGGVVGGAVPAASQGLAKLGGLASDAVEGVGGLFKNEAGKLANRATNSKMGREALDEGVLKFGDNAQNISHRVSSKMEGLLGGEESLSLPGVERSVDALGKIQKGVGEKIARDSERMLLSGGDTATLAAGAVGGPVGLAGAAAGIAGKNLVNSRGMSTGAVALDNIGEILKSAPQTLGKFAKPLQDAQARGALSPTLFVLQQTNPEFRELVYGGQEN